jgi:glutamate-1-semialdehyde aminotransferase
MEDFLARIGQETKDVVSHINQSTQNLRTELTDEIQRTKIELKTVDIAIDQRIRYVEEDIAAIKEDITANKKQMEQVKAIAERGGGPTVSANTAKAPTFDGKASWSTFRHFLEDQNRSARRLPQ